MARRNSARPDAVDFMMEEWRRECPELDASAMAVLGRLHRTYYRYQEQLTEVFASFDLTMSGFSILAALRRAGSPFRRTAGELADANLVTTGGITQRVDKLERAGLVRRERDPDDRRVVYVDLTEQGLDVIDKVSAAHFANERRMLAGLTDTEQERLADLLSRLETSLDLAAVRTRAE